MVNVDRNIAFYRWHDNPCLDLPCAYLCGGPSSEGHKVAKLAPHWQVTVACLCCTSSIVGLWAPRRPVLKHAKPKLYDIRSEKTHAFFHVEQFFSSIHYQKWSAQFPEVKGEKYRPSVSIRCVIFAGKLSQRDKNNWWSRNKLHIWQISVAHRRPGVHCAGVYSISRVSQQQRKNCCVRRK
jgi:hypothetical protein